MVRVSPSNVKFSWAYPEVEEVAVTILPEPAFSTAKPPLTITVTLSLLYGSKVTAPLKLI